MFFFTKTLSIGVYTKEDKYRSLAIVEDDCEVQKVVVKFRQNQFIHML
jgi:hypothetical protein